MFLRSQCDRQLYLSLFSVNAPALQAAGIPVPLKSRPGVQLITTSGREFEIEQFDELHRAIPDHVICNERYAPINMNTALTQAASKTSSFILQPAFEPESFRDVALSNLGLTVAEIQLIPRLAGLRPDVLFTFTRSALEFEILPNGRKRILQDDDQRIGISVVDLKNVTEANASYSAEVCLYAFFLSNWLAGSELRHRFFVSDKIYLWKHVEMPSFKRAISLREGSTSARRIAALLEDLQEGLVDSTIFMPSVRKFFKDDLPRVIKSGDTNGWSALPYHVNQKCGACDWLGIRSWLSPDDQAFFNAAPDNYCYPNAEATSHHSTMPNISRGAAHTLVQGGHQSVVQLVDIPSTDVILRRHTLLKRERSQIGSRARAIQAGELSIDQTIKISALAGSSHLNCEFEIIVNFDSGTGLLTGIAVRGMLFSPFGQTMTDRDGNEVSTQRLGEEAFVVERDFSGTEWVALRNFIATLSSWIIRAQQVYSDKNWGTCKTQICFWESRQYEELCNAFGRHLPAILALPERQSRAMAWLFPSEELLERDEQIAPGIVFISDIVEGVTRLPVKFTQTLLGVAEVYHHPNMQPRRVDPYYREPLGNAIPRERIFEIWKSTTNTVRMYGQEEPISKAIAKYGEILRAHAWALASISARLRADFVRRLEGKAPGVNLSIAQGPRSLAYDSKLWLQWDQVETSTSETSKKGELVSRVDHLEAAYKAIVLARLIERVADNTYRFEVNDESTEAKIDAGQGYLVLGYVDNPGYPLLTPHKLGIVAGGDVDARSLYTPLHKIIEVRLLEFNRTDRTAVVEIRPTWGGTAAVFSELMSHNFIPLDRPIYIMEGIAYNDVKTTREILGAIGNPAIAAPDARALRAMGMSLRANPTGTDPITTAARILWQADQLSIELVRDEHESEAILTFAEQSDVSLNDSQKQTIKNCVSNRLSLIWGPPGTGKTKTLSALLAGIVHEGQTTNRSRKILVTGPNYRAVEVLADRLAHALSQDSSLRADMYWAYSKSREVRPLVAEYPDHLNAVPLRLESGTAEVMEMVDSLNNPNVVTIIATTAHNGRRLAEIIHGRGSNPIQEIFDLVVIDESSQVPMSLALRPLSVLTTQGQLIVAGDHLQMPPISSLDAPVGAEYLVGSIQTYFIQRFDIEKQELLVNYRSNQDLVNYAKTLGYPQDLIAANTNLSLQLIADIDDIVSELPEDLPTSDIYKALLQPERHVTTLIHDDIISSQANEVEAKLVAGLAYCLRHAASVDLSHGVETQARPYSDEEFFKVGLGVVTPHKAQKALVIRELRKLFPAVDPDVIAECVDTVERFQGGERHSIIVSFGVGDVDIIQGEEVFLLQMERTNVAVSRAMAKCIVIMPVALAYHLPSDAKTAKTARAIKSYIEEFCEQRNSYNIILEGGEVRACEVRWH